MQPITIVAFVLVLTGWTASAFGEPAPNLPTKVSIAHTQMVGACVSRARQYASEHKWILGTPAVTSESALGAVWRVEFRTSNNKQDPYANRLTCWNGTVGKITVKVEIGDGAPSF